MKDWLKDAIFYQVYPSSFMDKNEDGIGDLKGIESKLDYIKDLGCNAIWINPIFVSEFKDGGYDISDYNHIDPRFGKDEDLIELINECHKKDLKIILDLVIGHTSDKHKWFLASSETYPSNYKDYYIWTDSAFKKFKDKTIAGLYDRDGAYYANFFACQPALNYGFNEVSDPSWQLKYDDERLKPLRDEVMAIMDSYLKLGIDGFRVDMAPSLVKECVKFSDKDEDIEGLIYLYNILINETKTKYPECIFLAEWMYPANSIGKCFFDLDVFGRNNELYTSLFRNDFYNKKDNYFSHEGKGEVIPFIDYYLNQLKGINGKGYCIIPSGSHDESRLAHNKNQDELITAFAFLLTLKHVPMIYYGDEIGIKHQDVRNKEGGYYRTGARTPMQWDDSKNKGFSYSENLYLNPNNDDISVYSELNDSLSLLSTVRALIKVRKEHTCLNADGGFELISNSDYPLIYRRFDENEEIVVAINPSDIEYNIPNYGKILYSNNAYSHDPYYKLGKSSFIIMIKEK